MQYSSTSTARRHAASQHVAALQPAHACTVWWPSTVPTFLQEHPCLDAQRKATQLAVPSGAAACSFFYASSACIYPEGKQLNTEVEGGGLKEDDAWPAQPQDAYGLEKLASEEICKHYDTDFGIACRIARFHNIYGPYGTWKGGREKAPAAFCRKALCAQVPPPASASPAPLRHEGRDTQRSKTQLNARHLCVFSAPAAVVQGEVEMWGDGKQTRSFTFIDDCVEGILRITRSDFKEPLNLGSTEMVSMNGMMDMVMSFGDRQLGIKHIPGPEGVRGRNSDNALILEKLGWEPTVQLKDGLKVLRPRC